MKPPAIIKRDIALPADPAAKLPAMYDTHVTVFDPSSRAADACLHSSVVFEYSIQTADVIVICTSCGEQTHLPDSVSCHWCERGMASPRIHGRMTAIDRTQPVHHTLDYHCRSCRGITRRAAMFPPSMRPRSST